MLNAIIRRIILFYKLKIKLKELFMKELFIAGEADTLYIR